MSAVLTAIQAATGSARVFARAIVAWFCGFFDATNPAQSMKHLLMFMAGATLCRGTIMICKAVAHQIYQGKPIDPQAVYILGVLAVPVAALAGTTYIFHKGKAGTDPSTIPDPTPDPTAK